MPRRVLGFLGFALLVCISTAPLARAQENPAFPVIVETPKLPMLDAPVAPLLIGDAGVELKISPNTAMPRIDTPTNAKIFRLTDLALQSSDYMDIRYVANSSHPDDPGLWERWRGHYGDQIHRLVSDYKNFYLTENMLYVGLAVGVAAPIANTHADQGIRDWYQRGAGQGRSKGLDNTALFAKNFGEYKYAIPAYLALSTGGILWPDNETAFKLGEFGDRSLRALAVGAPMVGILQTGLGSDRPFTQNSHWHPLSSNHGASGHAFVGAIPFLTAASMIDAPALQALLFAGSLAPAWSRLHTDDHYFSQVFLGWAIAYLSVQSVNQTENQMPSHFRIVPCDIPNGVGLGVQVQY